jgi:hypothetical protein
MPKNKYHEGKQAQEDFEEGMKTLFNPSQKARLCVK